MKAAMIPLALALVRSSAAPDAAAELSIWSVYTTQNFALLPVCFVSLSLSLSLSIGLMAVPFALSLYACRCRPDPVIDA